MNDYLISPEFGTILRAIHQSQSLREAAKILHCDPAGLFRKVKTISEKHDLFHKINGKWSLSPRGYSFLAWCEESMLSQRKALQSKTVIRLCSTTWFMEEMIIPSLKRIEQNNFDYSQIILTTPDQSFEESLRSGRVDFVMACHAPYDPSISFKKIALEKWVVVVPRHYQKYIKNKKIEEIESFLKTKNFIQHHDLNPHTLFSWNQNELNRFIVVDHLIGVRSAVMNNLGWSVVPRILVQSHLSRFELIEVSEMTPTLKNDICIWWLRNRTDLKAKVKIFSNLIKMKLEEISDHS